MTSQKPLLLEERIKLIIKERDDLINIHKCKNEKLIYQLTAEFYKHETGEKMSYVDYAVAVKIMYEERKK